MARKPRLAVISTFDDLCGIAGYTRFLVEQIKDHFDVEVFDLDQFLMRSQSKNIVRLADQQIEAFCTRAKEFDFFNIQLEFGTLGRDRKDIMRRFFMFANAAPALSVTFHTILPDQPDIPYDGNLLKNIRKYLDDHDRRAMRATLYAGLRKLSRDKPVNVIVHTGRDHRRMSVVQRLPSVHHHPLSFLSRETAQRYRAEATRANYPEISSLPDNVKLLGVFGFLSEYKGFDTAIRAMRYLPDDYHLVFFGGLHPNEIKRRQEIHPYIRTLLDEMHAGKTLIDDLVDRSEKAGLSLNISLGGSEATLKSPLDVSGRVHFLGTQSDEGLAKAMAVCDIVLLPYREVGQSSSGPMSLAMEMNARIIAARNQAFMQYARYFPDMIDFFDIDNHLELAHRILATPAGSLPMRDLPFSTTTNRDVYVKANTRPESGTP